MGIGARGSCLPSPNQPGCLTARSVGTLALGARCLPLLQGDASPKGTPGSVHACSSEEFHQVFEVRVNKVGGQIAIIIGCISVCPQRDEIPEV